MDFWRIPKEKGLTAGQNSFATGSGAAPLEVGGIKPEPMRQRDRTADGGRPLRDPQPADIR
jgi:hypothetical protein